MEEQVDKRAESQVGRRAQIGLSLAPELHGLVAARHRERHAPVAADGAATLGQLVESLGVPLTEVGALLVDGRPVPASHLPADGERVTVQGVSRPQPLPGPARFLLDVHLGTLARRLRLLGVDTAYENPDIGDAALAARSAADRRVLLSRDRGLLRRRELWAGAIVHRRRPAEQLAEVLARFAPPLAPWTRCVFCNGPLRTTGQEPQCRQLPDGTVRRHGAFARCDDCGMYCFHGAHHERERAMVDEVLRTLGVHR
ncbi:Mut7-C RNAse domain-containing protein [Kitasatospora nipponensis]|uniref:Mut7-C RNAse domain-containing protein n=1 Tax=Kitasatospora nipponensis TaxID=258049 RepID=UPI003CD05C2B